MSNEQHPNFPHFHFSIWITPSDVPPTPLHNNSQHPFDYVFLKLCEAGHHDMAKDLLQHAKTVALGSDETMGIRLQYEINDMKFLRWVSGLIIHLESRKAEHNIECVLLMIVNEGMSLPLQLGFEREATH